MNVDGVPPPFASLVIKSTHFCDLLNAIKVYRSLRQTEQCNETNEAEAERGVVLVYQHFIETHELTSSQRKRAGSKRKKKEREQSDPDCSYESEWTISEIDGVILRLIEKIESHISELSEFSRWSIGLVNERGEAFKDEMERFKGVCDEKNEELMDQEEEVDDLMLYVDETLDQESRKRQRHSQDTNMKLKQWLWDNMDRPFPNRDVKESLCEELGMTRASLDQWFINARRRYLPAFRDSRKNGAANLQDVLQMIG